MRLSIAELFWVLETGCVTNYDGEAVTQLEHALQCGWLAEQAGEPMELVVACLLHDIGHIVARLENPEGTDLRHQEVAADYLAETFGPEVFEPIRLHVAAKRYLCNVDSAYWETLSPASKASLEFQGGIFSEEEVVEFEALAFAAEAVKLRRYDELAKVAGGEMPGLAHFRSAVESCLKVGV